MKNQYQVRYALSPKDVKNYDTNRLREEFLMEDLMESDRLNLVYSHYDRYITGGVVPLRSAVKLTCIDPLKAEFFLERNGRRESGLRGYGYL